MKNSKESHKLIRQNEQSVKKSQKHDVNLQKNSTLYFQVGLIVCLLVTYGLLEMKFKTPSPEVFTEAILPDDPFIEVSMADFKIYEEPKVEETIKSKEKKVLLVDDPIVVDDDTDLKTALGIDTAEQNTTSEVLDFGDLGDLVKPNDDVIVEFINISEAPIYPGCEKAKDPNARKKCMSEKITKLIHRYFDGGDIASKHGLNGKQRINVQFLIDKTGKISDVKTLAKIPELEKEAERVIKKIPNMKPGYQRDKPVGVRYTLPIVFLVE